MTEAICKSLNDLSDEELIEDYNNGDIDAFNELYDRYATNIYSFLLRHQIDKAICNDILQILWEKILNKQDEFVLKIKKSHPPFIFKSYIYKMVRNLINDHFRQTKSIFNFSDEKSPILQERSSTEEVYLVDEVIAEEKLFKLISAIEQLPHNLRETFLLIKEAGLSLKEVAEIQEISIETAKTRRRYAYEKLKPYLEAMK